MPSGADESHRPLSLSGSALSTRGSLCRYEEKPNIPSAEPIHVPRWLAGRA
ncbi:hypothetical protein JMJ77_0000526 [Colletotrichum scovillei]|uniref:Uncharacterized protein n=1 Tax=Colletotrichum scovillei TaxID=1209932 RepID=A0A9P7UEB7_9PEZI|nr:hypothetical protein JMJ77_0000526 [Colletotrichum scovillei]KAG7071735.1 hypothetical protein JMJ76_0004603 [Colletotrichum scovillei]KAG7079950.1 hypothetical protein JMJ78_0007053 [Colletotrichum scovillei]